MSPPTLPPNLQAQATALRSRTDAELSALLLLPAAARPPPPPRAAGDVRARVRAASASSTTPLTSFAARVSAAQAVIDSLGYNHAPGYHHPVDKRVPFAELAASAARMLSDPAPLKCVEAAALAMVLTAGWEGVDRLALGFRSHAGGVVGGGQEQPQHQHRHVVLALRLRRTTGPREEGEAQAEAEAAHEAWAALGASRAPGLLGGVGPISMGGGLGPSPVAAFSSLSSLVARYAEGYTRVGHSLERVRVGGHAPHSLRCARRATWRRLRLSLAGGGGGGGDGSAAAPAAAAAAAASSVLAWPGVAAELDDFASAAAARPRTAEVGRETTSTRGSSSAG
jgi:hypothetical protein